MGSQPAPFMYLGNPQKTSFFNLLLSSVLKMTFIQSIPYLYVIYSSSIPYPYPCDMGLSCLIGAVSSTILAERLQNIQGHFAPETQPDLSKHACIFGTREIAGVAWCSCSGTWKPLAGEGCSSRQRPWLPNESLSGCSCTWGRCLRIHRDRQNELVLVRLVGKQEIWRSFHTTGAFICFFQRFFWITVHSKAEI